MKRTFEGKVEQTVAYPGYGLNVNCVMHYFGSLLPELGNMIGQTVRVSIEVEPISASTSKGWMQIELETPVELKAQRLYAIGPDEIHEVDGYDADGNMILGKKVGATKISLKDRVEKIFDEYVANPEELVVLRMRVLAEIDKEVTK